MEKYNLSDFGINKQTIKRKFTNDKNNDKETKLLLDKRTNKYTIGEIKIIVNAFYSDSDKDRKTSDEPLSVYYANKNEEKYKELLSLVKMKENCNFAEMLKLDINCLVTDTENTFTNNKKLMKKFIKISKKYNITVTEVERLFVKENGKRLKHFINI